MWQANKTKYDIELLPIIIYFFFITHFQAGDTRVAWEATGGAGRGVKEWTKSGRDGTGGPGGGRGREPAYTSRRGAGPRVGHPALWRRFASSYEGGPCTQQPVRVPAHISGYTPCQEDPGEFPVKYDRPVTLSRRSLRYTLQQCVSLPQSVLPSKMDVQVGGVAATCSSLISVWYCSCEMHLTAHTRTTSSYVSSNMCQAIVYSLNNSLLSFV